MPYSSTATVSPTSHFANHDNVHFTSNQAPSAVVMVRPHHFKPNPQTLQDNRYQQQVAGDSLQSLAVNAKREVTEAAEVLARHGVTVHLFDDTGHTTPDSVFPNNWFSTHHDGRIVLYPIYCANRRLERNPKIIDFLKSHYQVTQIQDFCAYETLDLFLEGTGSMVLDHDHKRAYAARSKRMDTAVLQHFCQMFDYQPVVFDAVDEEGIPIYHTNVMMSVGERVALVGLECVREAVQKHTLVDSLQQSGKTIVELSQQQIASFAGNVLELNTANGNILAMSQSAFQSLSNAQRGQLESFLTLVPIDVSTVELAGGSLRCMLAGIHLPKKSHE